MAVKADVGFTGTGGIATALAKGFCASPEFEGRIFVFDIDRRRTEALSEAYPEKVVVAASNQELIESADVVFPTLVPQVLEKVAPTLRFRKENHIIHIAAGTKLSKAAPWFAPACSVVRAVPLPFAAKRIGPVVLFGCDRLCEELLSLLGSVIKVAAEKDLEVLAAVTGLMVPYYGLVNEITEWCMSKGLDYRSAVDYTCYMNEALSTLMRQECGEGRAEAFMTDNATPGGMNELAWKIMRERGAYQPWSESLEKIGKYYGL
ncbi:MAG: NAD(P)-binding domain-containing protein [Synergistaceae bacterium]|nr:NAD(P)-binding domain-containing protein [Synergistaceae bacterium]